MDNILQKSGKACRTKFTFKFSACMSCTNAQQIHAFTFVSCQLFYPVSSCPYRKDGLFCWHELATVRGAGTSWMSSQPWRKSSNSLHSNRWKPVLVLQRPTKTKTFLSDSLLQHLLDFWTSGENFISRIFVVYGISDIAFKINILPTCDFFDTLVLQASSTALIAYIRY